MVEINGITTYTLISVGSRKRVHTEGKEPGWRVRGEGPDTGTTSDRQRGVKLGSHDRVLPRVSHAVHCTNFGAFDVAEG